MPQGRTMSVADWCATYVDPTRGTYLYFVSFNKVERTVVGRTVSYPQYDGKLMEIGQAIADAGELTDDDGVRLKDAGWSSTPGTTWMFARDYWKDAAQKVRYHNVDYGSRLHLASDDLARLAGVPGATWGAGTGYGISGICHTEPDPPKSQVDVGTGNGNPSGTEVGGCESNWSWSWRSGLHHSWSC